MTIWSNTATDSNYNDHSIHRHEYFYNAKFQIHKVNCVIATESVQKILCGNSENFYERVSDLICQDCMYIEIIVILEPILAQ